mgnify:CR=1 FL=1
MAEMKFTVKATFDEVEQARKECERLREELKKVTKSTDPSIIADLTEKYADASHRMKDLTEAASRAAYVMGSEFNRKMQAAAQEVYAYELQMSATKNRIEKLQQEITNKRITLGVTTDKSSQADLQKNIDYLRASLSGQNEQLKNLQGGAVGARQALENMRNEYTLYAGSANPAKDATNMLTDSMSQMIERMKSAPTAGEGMSSLFQRVTGDAHMLSATLLGGLGFEQLASSIFNTRSQFQQLEISFTTMLGSADKSKQLMDELIQTAAHTPFDMSSITSGAKQLLAYGTEAKDVNKTLVQLGDIASGLNIPLGDLVYLYGTTVAQGRMFTMDLRQFMGRGVPLAEELGKILHQNTTEVQESVSKGKVTSDIFKEAIANMTQAGGRFGGLMEQQSKTLEGQWSNIGDSIQQAFNEIGKKSEGVFSSGLSIISAMVENWQEVIKVIGTAVVAVGSYRAALMAAASIRKAEEAQQADDMMKGIDSEIKRLQDLEKANNKYLGKDSKTERTNKQSELAKEVADTSISDDFIKAKLEQATQEGVITEEMKAQLEAKRELLQAQQQATAQSQMEVDEEKRKTEELRQQKIESLKSDLTETSNKLSSLNDRDVELAKEYVDAMGELADAQDALSEANKLVEETAGGANLAFDSEGNAVNALEAKERLETATKQVNTAQTKLSTIESSQRGTALIREQLQERQATLQTQLNTASQVTNSSSKKANTLTTVASTVKNAIHTAGVKVMTTAELMLSNAVKSATMALKGMWAAMLSNPLTSVITLVTTLASAIAMFGDEEDELSVDTGHFGDSAENTKAKVNGLLNVMSSSTEGTDSYKKAKDELIQTYEQFGIKCDAEKDNLTTLKAKHDDFVTTLQLENAEREKANALMAASSKYTESRNNENENFGKDLSGHWYQMGQHVDKEDIGSIQMMYNSIASDEVLDRLSKLKQKVDDDTLSYRDHIKAVNDYHSAVKETFAPIDSFLEKQNYNAATIENTNQSILSHTSNLVKLRQSYKLAEESIMKAAAKNVDWNNAQARSRWVAQQNKQSIDALTSSTDSLIQIWNQEYGLNLKIHYDDSEIPGWMKNMTTKQLQDLINRRKSDINKQDAYSSQHKGHQLVTGTNGTYRTKQDNQQDIAMANSIIKSRTPKTSTTTGNNGKNTTKTTPKKDTDDPQARAYERKKAEEDYSKSVSAYSEKAIQDMTKNRINAMNDGYSKELAQITENANKERKAVEDGIDKLVEARKKRDQAVWVNSGKGRKANMWKQSKTDEEYKNEVLNETMKDSKGNPVKSNGMDMTIGMSVANQMNAIRDKAVKQNEEVLAKEAQSMYDYLKTYGTFQEQKLAIAADYAKRISEVENSTDSDSSKQWKIKSLKEEQKKDTDSVEASAIVQKIDWYQVFGNVGGIMKDALVPLLADLDKFVGTDKFQNLGADQQKSIVDAMQNIRNSIGNTSDLGWKDLARDVVAYQEALKNAKIVQEEYTKTETLLIPRIKDLQNQIANAKKSGNVAEQTRLQEELNKVQGQLAESGKKIVTANTKVRTSGQKLAQTTQNVTQPISAIHEFLSTSGLSDLASLWDSFDQLKGGIDGLKALDEAKNAADGLKDMGKEAGDAAAKAGKEAGDALGDGLSKAGFIGQIVSAILKILDVLKDGIGTLISSLIDTVLNAVNGILKNILSGDFITQIGGSLVSGIGNILNTISFGGFNSLFGVGGNAKEVAETTEKLTEANERLEYSINKLKDSIDNYSGMSAVKNYDKAYEAQKQINANSMEILKTQMGYHGAHHSNNYYWNLSKEDYSAINKTLAQQKKVRGGYTNSTITKVSSLADIYKLTPEQMADIRTYNQDVWKNMLDQGKYDKSEYWENYTELAEQLDSLTEQINQNLTQTSFDSMKQDFMSNLMDMNKSAKDFSNDFTTMLTQSMLQFAMSDLMESKLKPLYEKWAGVMRDEKRNLTKAEIDSFKQEYDELTKEGMAIRDNIADITGYKQSYEQSASSGAFESMSQDTGDELNGRFTAVQIATEGTYQVVQSIDQKLSQMLGLDSRSKEIVGATKEEPQPKKEETDNVTKTISDKLSKKMDDMANDSLNFKGSTLGMIDSINKHRLLSGKHSLEYESGLSTEDLADFINSKRTDMFRTSISELQQAVNQQVVTDTPNTRGDSLLTADISSICQNVGNIYVAVDEGRTILAQSMMYLQSIDERQESWHKPMLQAFNDIHELKDKMSRL